MQDLRIRQDHQVPSQGLARYSTFHRSSLGPHKCLNVFPITSCNSVKMIKQLLHYPPDARGIQLASHMRAL